MTQELKPGEVEAAGIWMRAFLAFSSGQTPASATQAAVAVIQDDFRTLQSQLAERERELAEARFVIAQAAVPLEGLRASTPWVDLAPNSWAEIDNAIICIRAFLASKEADDAG